MQLTIQVTTTWTGPNIHSHIRILIAVILHPELFSSGMIIYLFIFGN